MDRASVGHMQSFRSGQSYNEICCESGLMHCLLLLTDFIIPAYEGFLCCNER